MAATAKTGPWIKLDNFEARWFSYGHAVEVRVAGSKVPVWTGGKKAAGNLSEILALLAMNDDLDSRE